MNEHVLAHVHTPCISTFLYTFIHHESTRSYTRSYTMHAYSHVGINTFIYIGMRHICPHVGTCMHADLHAYALHAHAFIRAYIHTDQSGHQVCTLTTLMYDHVCIHICLLICNICVKYTYIL